VGSGNAYTLGALGTTASHSVPRVQGGWTLQHRHPDGRNWLVIGHFPTKDLAKETVKAFVESGYGPAEDFRVKRSKDPDHGSD
jgi:hypothetical protein